MFLKICGLETCNFIKERSQNRVFPVNIPKFRTAFLENTSGSCFCQDFLEPNLEHFAILMAFLFHIFQILLNFLLLYSFFRWPGWLGWNSVPLFRHPGSIVNCDYMWKVSSQEGRIPLLYCQDTAWPGNVGWNLSLLDGLKFHSDKPRWF